MRTLVADAHGRVQGVGYRYFVVEQARILGLVGWARNAPGGAVEVEAQGTEEALGELVEAMRGGPSAAYVTRVDVAYAERATYHNFEVRW